MTKYQLRVVDRGLINGVPTVDAYLEVVYGGAGRTCVMHTVLCRLSPDAIEQHLVTPFGELGVTVIREQDPCLETATANANEEPT